MQSKKTLIALSIITVLVLIFFGIQTTPQDTPLHEEPATEQPHQVENKFELETKPKPLATNELVPTKITALNEQLTELKDTDKTKPKQKLLLKTDTPDQRWTPYIDKTSEHYEKLLAKEQEASGPFVIGEVGYFKVKQGDEYVFLEASEKTVEETRDPFTVYNRHLDDLNNLEGYGDWSAEAELRVKKLFEQYYRGGSYDITVIQCREKTCLLEFSFTQYMDGVIKFLNTLHDNYAACQCFLIETAWPEERLAIIKIIFRD